MKFRSPTDEPIFLSLTTGHTVVVPREGIELAAMWNKTAVANGCIPGTMTDEEAVLLASGGPEAADLPGFNREAEITKALNKMLDSTEEGMFRNDGKPDLRKLNALLGFQAAREEADKAWDALMAASAPAKADTKAE